MKAYRFGLTVGAFLFSLVSGLYAAPSIGTQPSNATITMGQSATFTVAATGSGTLTYQWQGLISGSSTWGSLTNGGPINGATGATLTINAPAYLLNGAQVQCIVTDSADPTHPTTSNAATLTLNSPAPFLILAGPTDKSAFQGDTAVNYSVVVVPTGSNAAPTYQWQISTDSGGTWTNLSEGAPYSGTQTTALTIADPYTNLSAYIGSSTLRYRCNLTSGSYVIHAKGAALKIYATPTYTPTVTTAVGGSTASSIASNSTSAVTVQVAGIPTGGTVRIDRFIDSNNNGAADPGEPLVQSMTVTDGVPAAIGGVAVPNLPGDNKSTATGTVTATFSLASLSESGRESGPGVIRVVSPTGAFRPITVPFSITQPTLGQTVSGQVLVSGTSAPVPYASVVLLVPNNGNPTFVSATVSDVNGNYSIQAAPVNYILLPVALGYVASLTSLTQVAVTSNNNLSAQNPNLVPADYMEGGQLSDNNSANGNPPLRGVQMFFQSNSANWLTLTNTDSNGIATSGAKAATDWAYDLSSQSMANLGYVRPNNSGSNGNSKNTLETTSGSLMFQAANALIYGTLTDNSGTPVPLANVGVSANDQSNFYSPQATTDANGNYYLPVYGSGSQWYVNVDNTNPVFSTTYAAPQGQTVNSVAASAAYPLNFVAPVAVAFLKGTVTNGSNPAPNVQLDLLSVTGSGSNPSTSFVSSVTTASDGSFSFALGTAGANWQIVLDNYSAANSSPQLVGPTLVFNNVTTTQTGIAYGVNNATGTISGTVYGNNSTLVSFANVSAFAMIGSQSYNLSTQTNSSGTYSLPVIAGTWTVGASANNSISYTNQTVTVPTQSPPGTPTSNTANFAPPAPTAYLSGTVMNGSTPVSGVQIGANLQGGSGFVQTTTLTDGSFSLGVSSGGTWIVSLLNNTTYLANNLSVTLANATDTHSGLVIPVVTATGTLSGTVTGSGSTPVQNANVSANATINSVNYHLGTQTNSSGMYSFPVVAGSWTVNVNTNNGLTYLSQTVTVPTYSGTPTSTIQNFAPLAFNTAFTGTVTVDGTSVSGITVNGNLNGDSTYPNGLHVSTTTASDGTFSLPAVGSGSGTWNISVQYTNGSTSYLRQSLGGLTIADNAAPQAVGTIHVLTATGTISGTVTGTGGTPVQNANVNANATINGVTYYLGIQTDSSGTYSLPVVAGSWTVSVNANNSINYPNQNVTVSGSTTTVNFAAPVYTAFLNGQVRDANGTGSGVGYVQIGASPQGGGSFLQTTTDANGYFNLGVSGTGTWNLSLVNNSSYLSPGLPENITSATQTISGIVFPVVASTGTLSGTVKDANGTVVPNTFVSANATIGSVTYNLGTQTDSSGMYSFPVIAGSWMVNVNTNNGSTYLSQTVTVPTYSGTPTSTMVPTFQPLVFNRSFTGMVTVDGTPTMGVTVNGNLFGNSSYPNGLNVSTTTLSDGTFTLPAVDSGSGTWNLSAQYTNGSNSYVSQSLNGLTIASTTSPQPVGTIHVLTSTGMIYGVTYDYRGSPAPYLFVSGNMTVGGITYNVGVQSDTGGNYFLPVVAGTWNLQPGGSSLGHNLNFASQSVTVAGTPPTTNFLNFTATVFNGAPMNQTVILGQGATFSVPTNVPGGSGTLQWQVSTDGGTTYTGLVDGGIYYSGTATNNLNVSTALSMTGNKYRLAATFTYLSTSVTQYSAPATLTVNVNRSFTGMVTVDGTPTVGVTVNGNLSGNSSYPNGLNVSTTTLSDGTFTLPAVDSGSGTWNLSAQYTNGSNYYVSQSLNGLTIDSTTSPQPVGTIHVLTSTGMIHGVTYDYRGSPAPYLFVSGNMTVGGITYNVGVQSDTGGNYFLPVVDGTWNLQPGGSSLGHNLNFASQSVTVAGGTPTTPTSNALDFTATVFNGAPMNQTAILGQGATFSVPTNVPGGSGTLQWQVSTDGGATYTGLVDGGIYYSGTATNNLNVSTALGMTGNEYRLAATFTYLSTSVTQYSAPATLTVNTPSIFSGAPMSQTVVAGQGVTFSVPVNVPGNWGTPQYQWQLSNDGGATFPTSLVDGGIYYSGTATTSLTVSTATGMSGNEYRLAATITVNDSSFTQYSTPATLTLVPNFYSWQVANFTTAEQMNAAISGPLVVLGQDGLSNLVKYALGLPAKANATTGLPVVTTDGTYWIYTFTTPTAVTTAHDVTITVQVSTDLVNWPTTLNLPSIPSHSDGTTDTWVVTYPVASAPNAFFRLSVSQALPP